MHPIRTVLFLAPFIACGASQGPKFAASFNPYEGHSAAEKQLLAQSDRNIYPNDVREDPQQYLKSDIAWAGVVKTAGPDANDDTFSDVIITHHYWDWIEDHSVQKAKAFLSPRGEGEFHCHVETAMIPQSIELEDVMAVAYVRPLGMKNDMLHAACILRFFPKDWYATDVFEYGRNGEDFKILRVPLE